MFQVSASATAKKYGNFNFVPKNDSNLKSTSIKIENLDPNASSKPQLVVIGVSLDNLSRSTQLFICCAGVFVFYLVYGYVQVAIQYVTM